MSCVILCQLGSKCFDPKSQTYYDPWKSHIWDVVGQIRKWDEIIPIYFIIDEDVENILNYKNFNLLNIHPVQTKDLNLEIDLQELNYFQSHQDPLWKNSLHRFFYIHAFLKSKSLENCITFDNDVLIYTNLTKLNNKLKSLYNNSCITPVMSNELVCGFFWIKNSTVLNQINQGLIYYAKNPFDHHPTEMKMLYKIQKSTPNLIENLPIWPDGEYSKYTESIGGIFDPCTISQYLAGCNNGQPVGTILMHHILGAELQKQKYKIEETVYENKRCFNLKCNSNSFHINSLHMHKKSSIKNFI